MSLIDFILDVVCLLLWLDWRAAVAPAARPAGTTLPANIRPAGPARATVYQWSGLPLVLLARTEFYRLVGPSVHWNPTLRLGPAVLAFRSDIWGRMLIYSVLGFATTLGVVYVWLLFLSALRPRAAASNPVQQMIATWLGRLDDLPLGIKLALPLVATPVFWLLLHPLLVWLAFLPPARVATVALQGGVIGLSSVLTLKYPLAVLLILYLANSYLYMGEFPIWQFVNEVTRILLTPWRKWLPVRLWKIDLSPIFSVVLILVVAEMVRRGLDRFYLRFL